VPQGEIVAVSICRRVSRRPSGEYFSYVPALERAVPDAEPLSLPLTTFGWPEEKARALADWFSQELGVPFKFTKEETEAASPM
jgi:hypothetical protein